MTTSEPGMERGKAQHYVSSDPFDPYSVEQLSPEQERYYLASQWQLMWWKLKRHRLAVICGVILALNYATIMFSEIIAPSLKVFFPTVTVHFL